MKKISVQYIPGILQVLDQESIKYTIEGSRIIFCYKTQEQLYEIAVLIGKASHNNYNHGNIRD